MSLRFGHSRREAQAVLDRDVDLAYVIRWHLPNDAQFELLHTAELTFVAAALINRLAGATSSYLRAHADNPSIGTRGAPRRSPRPGAGTSRS